MIDLRKNLIERRSIELDPELADHYLTYNTYVTQRIIRPLHVKSLASKMKCGLFRFGEISFAVNDTKRDLLVNGQHVCSAVVESGITVPCIFEKYKVDDDEQISELFRQFEHLPRSLKDMIKVEAHALGITWPAMVSSIVVSAAILDSGSERFTAPATTTSLGAKVGMGKDEKVKLLRAYLKKGAFVADILTFNGNKLSGHGSHHIKRAAVVNVMMNTWEKDSSDAKVFWARVRDGENLTKDMPEMKIREFLLLTRQTVRQSTYIARSVRPHEYAYRCILAWNSFRTGKRTVLAYRPTNPIPKIK